MVPNPLPSDLIRNGWCQGVMARDKDGNVESSIATSAKIALRAGPNTTSDLELQCVQPTIGSVVPQQLIVRSGFDDSPAFDDVDPVGARHGRQAMGYDQGRPPAHEIGQRFLH